MSAQKVPLLDLTAQFAPLRGGVLEWQPAEEQAGSHRVVLAGSTSGGAMQQSFDIAVATSTLRVAGDVSVSEGGRVFATSVGRQQLAGVGVSVPGGACRRRPP